MNETTRAPISLDALLFALLTGAYVPTRFIIPLPPIIPGSTVATVGLILSIGLYWTLDLLHVRSERARQRIFLGKWLLIIIAIGLIVIAPLITNVFLREQTAVYEHVHDGQLQTEIATRLVLGGKNPYAETYYDTPLALVPFHVDGLAVNPALEHYAYLPLTFLLPLPIQALIGDNAWFDLRLIHVVFFCVVLLGATLLASQPSRRLMLVIALGLNPLFVAGLIEGRNDVMVLSWLIITWILLQRGKITASAVTLALACGTKHPAWLFVPFYFVYVSQADHIKQRFSLSKTPLIVFAIITGAIILPWFLMNPPAFVDDTVSYLNGTSALSYPISGFSFGSALVEVGLLPSNMAQFPFGLLQLAVGLPVLFVLLRRQWRRPDLAEAIAGYAIILFITQIFSRFFNDNYLGLIISIIAVAALMDAAPALAPELQRPRS